MSAPRPQRPLVLDHLRSFEAVARRAGFGAAAEELHVTQSAVSRQIKSLEDELGAPLFTRGTRRVELTQAGQMLLRATTPALARIDTAVRQIRQQRGRAQVNLTTFASFASLWLLPRLPGFERLQPTIDIRVSAIDRLVDVDDLDHDLALRQCRPGDAPPGATRLFGEVVTPVIGTALSDAIARGAAPPLDAPDELAACTLIEMQDDRPSSELLGWPHWLARHGLAGLEPRRWISVNYTHQQVQTALAGQGVALARLALVHDALERGDLVEPFGLDGRLATEYAYWQVTMANARPRPELESFLAWLGEAASETRAAIGES